MADERANEPNALNKAGDPIIFDAIDRTELTTSATPCPNPVRISRNRDLAIKRQRCERLPLDNSKDICLYLLHQGANATVVDHSGITMILSSRFNSNILPTSYQGRYTLAERSRNSLSSVTWMR